MRAIHADCIVSGVSVCWLPFALCFVTQALFHELVYDGINTEVMHASRTQVRRNVCGLFCTRIHCTMHKHLRGRFIW